MAFLAGLLGAGGGGAATSGMAGAAGGGGLSSIVTGGGGMMQSMIPAMFSGGGGSGQQRGPSFIPPAGDPSNGGFAQQTGQMLNQTKQDEQISSQRRQAFLQDLIKQGSTPTMGW